MNKTEQRTRGFRKVTERRRRSHIVDMQNYFFLFTQGNEPMLFDDILFPQILSNSHSTVEKFLEENSYCFNISFSVNKPF